MAWIATTCPVAAASVTAAVIWPSSWSRPVNAAVSGGSENRTFGGAGGPGGAGRPGGGLRHETQGGVGVEDLLVQGAQLGAWFDAHVGGDELAGVVVSSQGVGLPARAVQGEHVQGVQVLIQRVGTGELAEFGDGFGVAAEVQAGLQPDLQCLQPQLTEPVPFSLPERVGRYVGERLAPPQRQRGAGLCLSLGPGPVTRSRPGVGDQCLEPGDVQLARADLNQVPARAGDDRGLLIAGQSPSQPGDMIDDRGPDSARLLVPPGLAP
jgi:hypothetical protein